MPHMPFKNLIDKETRLPEATRQSFWLKGSAWQVPDHENADTFVEWLVREGLLVRDPIVEVVLQNQLPEVSPIERARQTASLLERSVSIADAIYQVGYADQPHLSRSLKRLLGQTPAQIIRSSRLV